MAKPPLWIRGYEADPRLIQPARNNIERAGLSHWIKIYQGEVATFEPRLKRDTIRITVDTGGREGLKVPQRQPKGGQLLVQ